MKLHIFIIFLFSGALASFPLMAESNKKDVQASLGDGWSLNLLREFGTNESQDFNEKDFNEKVSEATECYQQGKMRNNYLMCRRPIAEYFNDNILNMARRIANRPQNGNLTVGQAVGALLRSLSEGRAIPVLGQEVHMGVAVYQNWDVIPLTRSVTDTKTRTIFLGLKARIPETRERRVPRPKSYQTFIRFRDRRE